MPPPAVLAGAIEEALGIEISESPLSPSRLFELSCKAGA
jgi:CO/xanthine dehydrogenase Mo-binding subunit